MDLIKLSEELLQTIYREDLEYDFKQGGMIRGQCKAKEIQTNSKK